MQLAKQKEIKNGKVNRLKTELLPSNSYEAQKESSTDIDNYSMDYVVVTYL